MDPHNTYYIIHNTKKARLFSELILLMMIFVATLGAKEAAAMTLKTSAPRGSLATGLISWWTFDGADSTATTLLDRSGNNVTLTKYGPTMAPGKIGQGINCNGTGDYALSGGTAFGDSGYITVAAWIKPRSVAGGPIAVDRSTNWRLLAGLDDKPSAMWSSTADPWGTNLSGVTPLSINTWQHVAFTFDGANAKVWLNGKVDGTKPATGTLNTNGTQTAICTYNAHNSNFLNGQIDDVRVYSRVLSPSEMKQLYSMGAGAKIATPQKQSQFQEKGINSGLVGWWTMDGADTSATLVYDKSTKGNNGTRTALTPVAGKLGQGMSFDGSASLLDAGTGTSLDFGTGSFSIGLWLKTTQTSYGRLVTKRAGATWYSLILNYNQANRIGLETAAFAPAVNNTAVNDGKWHHFFMVKSGTSASFYLDGAPDGASAGVTADINTTGTNLLIGNYGGQPFAGQMDDVRVYSRALSAAEIRQLYLASGNKVGTTPQAQTQFQNKGINYGLKGWWTFDGADVTATQALDKSGYNNTGTRTAVTPVAGKMGQAFNFTGTAGMLTLPDMSSQVTASAGTISVWAKAPQIPVAAGPIMVEFSDQRPYFYLETTGSIYLYWAGSSGMPGGGSYSNPVSGFSLNTWHHAVATWSGDTYKIYLDGVLKDSASGCTFTAFTNGTEMIGGTGSVFWNGQLDDVRLYNRAISAAEVKQLYNMGK